MKECPFCAREIEDEAVICKHCGKDLAAPQPPRRKRRPGRTALLGLGVFIVGVIFSVMFRDIRSTELFPGYPLWRISGLLGMWAFILFIVAIVQAIRNRMAK